MQTRDFETVAELREAFPSAFLGNGTVNLAGQAAIRTLPPGMVVSRHLILDRCSNLIETPHDLTVKGGMTAKGCHSLEKIGRANIEGAMYILNCDRLHTISPDLKVGDFVINYCKSLSHLPDTIKVDRDVCISYCQALKSIPWKNINGHFNAVGCSELTSLPSPFSVAGEMDISGTSGLELHNDVSASLIFGKRCEKIRICSSLLERMGGKINISGSENTPVPFPMEQRSPSPF